MKALLLDAPSTTAVSMVYSQTEIFQKEVYLLEVLQKTRKHEVMSHIKAAVIVQPTEENISLLCKELQNPKFGKY